VSACDGWTTHEIAAHVAGIAVEVIRHLEPFLQGDPVPQTRGFEEREAPLQAIGHPALLRRLDAGEERMRRLAGEVLEKLTFVRDRDRDGHCGPGNIHRIRQSRIDYLGDAVRPSGGYGAPSVTVYSGRGRCHNVGLMSAVESRSLEKLLQLLSLRTLDDFLERHKVGRDSPDPAVEQIDATRVACGVPHVDGKDSQVHKHPSWPGDINLPSAPQRAPAPAAQTRPAHAQADGRSGSPPQAVRTPLAARTYPASASGRVQAGA